MHLARWAKLVKQAVVAWSDDDAPSMGAAISYYTLFSLGLILGLAFLPMVSLAVSAARAAFGSYVGSLLPGQELLLQALNTGVAIAVTTVLFAMIFQLMPTARVAWRDVWVGAVVTALLFEVGTLPIGLYLGKSALANSFAGARALVVLLGWVYQAARIFLLRAESTKVYAHAHGSAKQRNAGHARAADGSGRGQDLAHPLACTLAHELPHRCTRPFSGRSAPGRCAPGRAAHHGLGLEGSDRTRRGAEAQAGASPRAAPPSPTSGSCRASDSRRSASPKPSGARWSVRALVQTRGCAL